MNKVILKKIGILLLPAIIFYSCKSNSGTNKITSKRAGINEVIVHESADFDKLNPITSTSSNSGFVSRILFPWLISIHPETFENIPYLAEARPVITPVEEGMYKGGETISYRIRTEAVWPNGTPITGHDIDFTYRVYKNPQVDCAPARPYLEFIDSIKVDEADPKSFTLYCKDRYFLAEEQSGQWPFIPEYVYDPEHIMRKFTVHYLNNPKNLDKLKGNADIIRFAENFNSEKYQREKGFVVGCGPYEFDSWTTGQRMTLTKVKNWWGEKFTGKVPGFENYPDKITFEIVPDITTALTSLKDETFDVMRGIPSKNYRELEQDSTFLQLYNLHKPVQMGYSFLGLNMKRPKTADKKVRQALASAMDVQQVIDVLSYGLAQRIASPISPSKSYYNKSLVPYEYNLEKSKTLLAEAGWKDEDGDGVLEKKINGKVTPMSLELLMPPGSPVAENVALMFQKSLKKIGVKLEIVQKEWTVFLDQTKAHDFDIMYSGWDADPILDDMKQIWHTTAYNGGSNYVGFGNQESDDIIEKIRYETDVQKRNEMYYKIQEIIYEETPYIFLVTPLNKIAIHKRFHAKSYSYRPGFMPWEFTLNPDFGTTKAVAVKP